MARRIGWRSMGDSKCCGCGLWVAHTWLTRHEDAGCEARVAVAPTLWNQTQRTPKESWFVNR